MTTSDEGGTLEGSIGATGSLVERQAEALRTNPLNPRLARPEPEPPVLIGNVPVEETDALLDATHEPVDASVVAEAEAEYADHGSD